MTISGELVRMTRSEDKFSQNHSSKKVLGKSPHLQIGDQGSFQEARVRGV